MCKESYLDNAATSRFKPREVIRAVTRELRKSANAGRGGHAASIKSGMLLENCREEIRKLSNLPDVILTKNCTEALNLAIFGICTGGTVIASVFEHNSVLRPLYKLQKDNIIKLKLLNPLIGKINAKSVSEALTSDTRCVVLSEMSNVTGSVVPVAEIATVLGAKKIPFIVDGAQSLGHTITDYSGVTALCASGHKGLHGPQGTGFLALNANCPKLTPLLYGGTGTDSESVYQPTTMPEGYESGTQNAAGFAGLAEGIKWTEERKSELKARCEILSYTLISELRKIPAVHIYTTEAHGIVTFNHKKAASATLADELSKNKIYVRGGLHCAPLAHKALGTLNGGGALRVSFGACNTERDVKRLVDFIKDF